MRRAIHRSLLVFVAATLALAAQKTSALEATEPSPKLKPEEVVAIQVEALKRNSELLNDGGIAITFNFASPANRRMTGPLSRFTEMLKNPLYAIMLDFERYETGKIEIDGDIARQRVTLINAKGDRGMFLFVLSKQKDAPYQDCWMTDMVQRVNPDHEKPLVA